MIILNRFAAFLPKATFVALFLLAMSATYAQEDATAFTAPDLNVGLEEPSVPVDRDSPYDVLHELLTSDDPERAAHLFQLEDFPPEQQSIEGARAASKLALHLREGGLINWEDVPSSNRIGDGRRSYRAAVIDANGEEFPVVLQRYRVGDAPAVWLFSPDTTALALDLPFLEASALGNASRITSGLARVPLSQWGLLLGTIVLGLLVGRLLAFLLRLLTKRGDGHAWSNFIQAARWPISIFVGVITFSLAGRPFMDLPASIASVLDLVVILSVILAVAWLLISTLSVVFDSIQDVWVARLANKNEIRARSFRTQISAVHRLVVVLIIVGAGAAALSQFELFNQLGKYVLASAGVAGLVLGLAAQRTIGNLFAGLQVAIAQPVRIGDSVLFQSEWGWIEEIAFTYVVIRTWDLRRVIVPVNYLLDNPIQNWTRTNPNLIGTVFLYADYRLPVEKLRDELARVLEKEELWNRNVPPILHVTDCKQEVMELRALCSANTAPEAWDLRCIVREKLLTYLQTLDGGKYLPRTRVEFSRDSKTLDEGDLASSSNSEEHPWRGLRDSVEEDESGVPASESHVQREESDDRPSK